MRENYIYEDALHKAKRMDNYHNWYGPENLEKLYHPKNDFINELEKRLIELIKEI